MAYAQWISITIDNKNVDSPTYSIKNAKLSWGKFYKDNDKDKEISAGDVDKIEIPPRKIEVIYSCGREDASSGTQGSFDLYDGDTKVGKYSWDCPWGSKTNTFGFDKSSVDYSVDTSGGSTDSGAIGNITMTVFKFPV